MKSYEYSSYDEYVDIQKKTTREKLQRSDGQVRWVSRTELIFIADLLQYLCPDKERFTGVCHGARTSWEIEVLEERLGKSSFIIGTDITPECLGYQGIIKQDFNKPLPWDFKADFVYSNSFDHVFEPLKTLKIWKGQLKSDGILLLEWTDADEKIDAVSSFAGSISDYEDLLAETGFRFCNIRLGKMASEFYGPYKTAIVVGYK